MARSPWPHPLLALQRQAGNAAVGRLLAIQRFHRPGVIDNGRLTRAVVTAQGELAAGTYVEVRSINPGQPQTLRVRAWSGSHGATVDIPADAFAREPQLDNPAPSADDRGPPTADPDERISYRPVDVPLFGPTGTPSPDHVTQGDLSDCHVVGAALAVVHANPAYITNLFSATPVRTPEGVYYRVALFAHDPSTRQLRREERLVSTEMPTRRPNWLAYAGWGPRRPVALWPLLLEKRFAFEQGGYDDLDVNTSASFQVRAITGLAAEDNADPDLAASLAAVSATVGAPAGRPDVNPLTQPDAALVTLLEGYVARRQPVTFLSRDCPPGSRTHYYDARLRVLGNHTYALHSVTPRGVVLRNPHSPEGRRQPLPLTAGDIKRVFEAITVGSSLATDPRSAPPHPPAAGDIRGPRGPVMGGR